MRLETGTLISAATVALAQTSVPLNFDNFYMADLIAVITAANPANKTFATGTMAVTTLTFPTKAGAVDGNYVAFYDASGNAWAAALDTTGGAANTPTGAVWAAIPAGRKSYVDISGDVSAADVATTVKAALDALVGFTAVISASDAAADGTLVNTQVAPGPISAASVHNKNDSGAGTITQVQNTAGVAGVVSVAASTATIPAHGYATGVKVTLTTTGTLPGGLATATPYYLIVVDANTLQFASSQANALAGTAITLTTYGSSGAVHTVAVNATIAGTITIQKNDDSPLSLSPTTVPTWVDIGTGAAGFSVAGSSSQSFSGATTLSWKLADVSFRNLQAVVAVTSGTVLVTLKFAAKGF